MSTEAKPRRRNEWVTAFDRDLIRCATKNILVGIELAVDVETIECTILQVDKYFIRVIELGIDGDGLDANRTRWINKSMISQVWTGAE